LILDRNKKIAKFLVMLLILFLIFVSSLNAQEKVIRSIISGKVIGLAKRTHNPVRNDADDRPRCGILKINNYQAGNPKNENLFRIPIEIDYLRFIQNVILSNW